MENVKINENRLVPDIRQENIETIIETYAPSGGGEQTARKVLAPYTPKK